MKLLILTSIAFVISCSSSLAQRGNYKFYSKEDSIAYWHYDLVLKEGRGISFENGKPKLVIVDSSYMENSIPRDSAIKMLRQIPKFVFDLHQPNQEYCTLNDLKISNRRDTITHIALSGKAIRKLPLRYILQCKNLREIELTGTAVKKIPWLLNWSIFGLDSLQTLKIFNHSTKKPLTFSKNTKITELIYRDNPFSPLPQKFHKLENLKEIDFVKNDFQESRNMKLNKLKKLKKINLSHNSVQIAKLATDTAYSLKNIILSFNNLTAVPKEIGYFKNLTDLQLAENDIISENIDPAIGTLKKLQILSLYKNELTEAADYIFAFPDLIELDLYYNQIEKIPNTLGQLSKLERLFLANNKLYSLPESIGKLINLKELYLHHNRISYLPESICRLKDITDFHINNNYFPEFPSCILAFHKLEDLDISNTQISSIPPELKDLQELEYLWLRGISFEAQNKEEAEAIRATINHLQQKGVKISIELK